jgi:hypothetical protein
VALAAILMLPAARAATPVSAGDERLVLAFYYAWYDQKTWTGGRVPDVPQTPYNSSDRDAMARQVDQAKGAGIDAFVLNWWGKGNQTEKNLKTLLDVAAEKGFRVAVDFDPNSPFMRGTAAYVDNLRHLLAGHAAHPAYLRCQGRPVVFFYNVSRLSAAAWRGIRDHADPNRQALWIAEGTSLAYLDVFDGHHLYSVTWPNRIAPAQTLSSWGDKIRTYNREHGTSKIWVATVMPGYDDRRARSGGFARARQDGAYYRQCWQAAIDSRPHWVVINSFNEWPEGSYIEPSRAFGSLYLDLTGEWAGRFKGASYTLPAPAAARPASASAAPSRATPRSARASPAPTPIPPDHALPDGWYYSQGELRPGGGFSVTNEQGIAFWDAYRDAGGPTSLGYPISGRYRCPGLILQSFERGLLAWDARRPQVIRLDALNEEALAALLAGRGRPQAKLGAQYPQFQGCQVPPLSWQQLPH